MSTRRLISPGIVLLALLLLSGCAGPGVPLHEISDAPIAFVHWDAEAARQRQDILADLKQANAGPLRDGVARLETVASLLNPRELSQTQRRLAQLAGRIALLNPRTLELTLFSAAPANARPLAWSADHSRLLFSSRHMDGETPQIFEYDFTTLEARKLTRGPRLHLEADYAPDGRLVVAWLERSGREIRPGMEIRPADGGLPIQELVGLYPSSVRFAPQGDRLLYVETGESRGGATSGRDPSRLVLRSLETGKEPDFLARGREGVFSPDGSWIVFTSQTSKGWQLRRIRSDGSARSTLGASVRDERFPAVSPDGKHVVYLSNEDGIGHLYLRRMDGSGDRILFADGEAAYPVW